MHVCETKIKLESTFRKNLNGKQNNAKESKAIKCRLAGSSTWHREGTPRLKSEKPRHRSEVIIPV